MASERPPAAVLPAPPALRHHGGRSRPLPPAQGSRARPPPRAKGGGRKIPHRPLSNETINKTIVRLGQVLDLAVEYGHLPANPARGKRRKLRTARPQRSYIDTAAQIAALLDAAGELDREAQEGRRHVHRRAMLATLTFAGLRLGELLSLRWRDADLGAGWLRVGEAKTDAGTRRVKIRGALRDELEGSRPARAGPRTRSCSPPLPAVRTHRATSAGGCWSRRSSGRTSGWPRRARLRCRKG